MSDKQQEVELLFFFDGKPEEYGLYKQLEARILSAFPNAEIEVKKTQISFKNRYIFACASLLRRKKGMPKNGIIVTFGLPYRVISPRIMESSEPYPGRWTHHVAVGENDIDEELMGWLGEAHAFAADLRRR